MKKVILFTMLMVYTIFICSCSHQDEINSTQKHKENIIKDDNPISKCKLEQSIISDDEGCSLLENKEKVDLDIAEDLDISIELLRKEECYKIKYYSPDHKNYILAAIEEIDEEENIIYKIYLNNREIFLSNTDYLEFDNNSIKWLDNENVLITGEYIYKIE
ncbi:MAG: hypothetical protein N4A50_02230 [Vallitalea sp.]|jgi:hypothetical protein|nr:hypothetical protein [Vallitalea sp.]